MEELREMVKAVMETVIELTARAVKAEQDRDAYQVNMDRFQRDAVYWRTAFNDKCRELEKLKGETDAKV